MNKKTGRLTRILTFFEQRGFYIILFLCIGAIGISGYVLFFEGQGKTGDIDNSSQIEESISDNTPIQEAPVIKEMPVEIPSGQTDVNKSVPKKAEPDVKVNKPVPIPKSSSFYVPPIPGAVTKPFSGDRLLKDETMGDWRAHLGADFEALDGERVASVADGTVEDIYYDDMLGYCIRILHKDNIVSYYCNLMKNATVRKGDVVKAGDIIGGIGNSMLSEKAQKPHLHLEMTKDGMRIDPMTLLPKK